MRATECRFLFFFSSCNLFYCSENELKRKAKSLRKDVFDSVYSNFLFMLGFLTWDINLLMDTKLRLLEGVVSKVSLVHALAILLASFNDCFSLALTTFSRGGSIKELIALVKLPHMNVSGSSGEPWSSYATLEDMALSLEDCLKCFGGRTTTSLSLQHWSIKAVDASITIGRSPWVGSSSSSELMSRTVSQPPRLSTSSLTSATLGIALQEPLLLMVLFSLLRSLLKGIDRTPGLELDFGRPRGGGNRGVKEPTGSIVVLNGWSVVSMVAALDELTDILASPTCTSGKISRSTFKPRSFRETLLRTKHELLKRQRSVHD